MVLQKSQGPCHDYFYSLKNVSFCAFHPRDHRYLGFITKHPTLQRFACHVFIGQESTRPVAEAVGWAILYTYNFVTFTKNLLIACHWDLLIWKFLIHTIDFFIVNNNNIDATYINMQSLSIYIIILSYFFITNFIIIKFYDISTCYVLKKIFNYKYP